MSYIPHSAEWHARRVGKITGSRAGAIMAGGRAMWSLWEEMTGRLEPVDLSDNIAVQLGSATEDFNAYWFERVTGRAVKARGLWLEHPSDELAANLDGLTTTTSHLPAIWEGKHVGGFEPLDTVIARYQPQLHHCMLMADVQWAVLSVIIGNGRFEYVEIPLDPFYAALLMERELAFLHCVQTDTPPPDMPAVTPPVPPEEWRAVNMDGSNEWAAHAATWLESRDSARAFDEARVGIKGLIAPDVGRAFGYGIQATRSKSGAITIRAV